MRFHSRLALGVAIAGFVARLYATPAASCSSVPSLKSAASFAVLGGTAVKSSESTIITGNLGVSPGNTITGPPTVKIGATYRNDSVAREAQRDATAAYNDLAGRTCGVSLTGDLGGKTLPPNVYNFSASAQLTGPLILDALNDPNAVWIFRIGGALTTAINASVLVINGGHESNIFWQVGDSATLGAKTAFLGNVLALKDITLNDGASVSGRLLAQGVVTLNGNNVSLCCDPITLSEATFPNGTVGIAYGPITITAKGGSGSYAFAELPGSLPPGVTISPAGIVSGVPTAAGSFSPTIIATDSTKVCSGSRTYNKIEISNPCPVITVLPSAVPPTPTVPYDLPPATVGVPYSQTFSASCAAAPYLCTVTDGAVPPGLMFANCTLSGLPTTPGIFTFTLKATDVVPSAGSQIYRIEVTCPITPSPLALPNGTVCTPYIQPITPGCGTAPYVCSVISGTLPDGLTLGSCVISETPTVKGSFAFTVKATYAGFATTQVYTIEITCPVITISPPVLPPASTCQFYCVKLTPSCQVGATQFSKTAGTLPPGVTLSPDGNLCGMPSLAGTYSWTVTFTDSVSGCTGSRTYSLEVSGVTIAPPTLPDGFVCVPYNQTITASCAIAPYTCSLTGMLPAGLLLASCTISGTPTTPGTSPFTVTVTDAVGNSASKNYSILVTGGIVLSPAALPAASLGDPYNAVVTATGGTPPYTFAVTSGALPPLLSLSPAGVISGTPTVVGIYNFTITATDANGCTGSHDYTIIVAVGGPTLSGWGMIVLSILLLGAGFVTMRRGGLA